ncbi:MAG: hypothetical protein D6683_00155 [Actinomyces sp.]|nr:MAG: hypothetical protein D6683_00155 [Actinomyces sp.]
MSSPLPDPGADSPGPPFPPPDARSVEGVEGFTCDGSSRHPRLLADATALLDAELPDPRFVDTAHLRWTYHDNPDGPAWERYHYVADPRVGHLLVAHYANLPRSWRGPGGVRSPGVWSQNAVTRSGHQRARHFTRLGLEIYAEAADAGRSFAVGVTNERSTGAVVRYMGWHLVGPLPVCVVAPLARPVRHGEGRAVTTDWLQSPDFDEFAALVDRHPVGAWATDWRPEVLRWRLAAPHVHYRVDVFDEVAVVSTRSRWGPVPAAVVLKIFPLVAGTAPVDATRAVAAVARAHRAVFAVYAGFNRSVRVRGVRPPRRIQPSPLNLVVRALDPGVDHDTLELDTFEFLDMDAY